MILNDTWDKVVGLEFQQPYLRNLLFDIEKQRNEGTIIYPLKGNLFTTFKLCDYHETKVVILGFEPFNNVVANGLAFSASEFNNNEVSDAIYKSINKEFNYSVGWNDPDLSFLSNQGVLLLNTILTVEKDKPLSHRNKGWEQFTTKVMQELNRNTNPIVFLLLGKYLQNYSKLITNPIHTIINREHPSIDIKEGRNWDSNNCFKEINNKLTENNKVPIQWNVPVLDWV